jgi:hypothetical protein
MSIVANKEAVEARKLRCSNNKINGTIQLEGKTIVYLEKNKFIPTLMDRYEFVEDQTDEQEKIMFSILQKIVLWEGTTSNDVKFLENIPKGISPLIFYRTLKQSTSLPIPTEKSKEPTEFEGIIFHELIRRGDIENVKKMLELSEAPEKLRGFDDIFTNEGYSIEIAQREHVGYDEFFVGRNKRVVIVEMIQLLLQYGANPILLRNDYRMLAPERMMTSRGKISMERKRE